MIFDITGVKNIYVSGSHTDMRKSVNGLALIVSESFDMNVMDRSMFIFTNRSRTLVKILYYECGGFCLFMRRLEKGRFKFREHPEKHVITIDGYQLSRLIEGLEYESAFSGKKPILL